MRWPVYVSSDVRLIDSHFCSGLCPRHVTHTAWFSHFRRLEGGMTICCQSGWRRGHCTTSLEKKTVGVFYGLKRNRSGATLGKESKKCDLKNLPLAFPASAPESSSNAFSSFPSSVPAPPPGPQVGCHLCPQQSSPHNLLFTERYPSQRAWAFKCTMGINLFDCPSPSPTRKEALSIPLYQGG